MPETRVIDRTTLQMAQFYLQQAREHRLLAAACEEQAKRLIAQDARIDLADENWLLDLERGLVTRQDQPPIQETSAHEASPPAPEEPDAVPAPAARDQ